MDLGLITIGQSPRVDIVKEMKSILCNINILEIGVLDNLSSHQMMQLSPRDGDGFLVTKLRDGTEVRLCTKKILSHLQKCISKLENEVDMLCLLCTGQFPGLISRKLLLDPHSIILKNIEAIGGYKKLGIIVPEPLQIDDATQRWSSLKAKIYMASASPYSGKEQDFINAAKALNDCDLIVLDCLGYNQLIQKVVKEISGKPVVLPRSLIAYVILGLGGE